MRPLSVLRAAAFAASILCGCVPDPIPADVAQDEPEAQELDAAGDEGALDDESRRGDADDAVDTRSAPLSEDADGDGFSRDAGDCDDGDAAVHPRAGDRGDDGIDSDCDQLDCWADFGSAAGSRVYWVACVGPFDFHQGDSLCAASGYGGLPSIRSKAEQDDLASLLVRWGLARRGGFWFGYSDAESEGAWLWSDGWAGSFSAWNAGEPNNKGHEDCATLAHFDPNVWNDLPCSYSVGPRGFLCAAR